MQLEKVTIKRFRSINNLTINLVKESPIIICGSNNVGKTNFLRALNLFFSLNKDIFDAKKDIPYDIEEAKRGGSYNTKITAIFNDKTDNKNDKYEITTIFKRKKDFGNVLEIKAKKNNKIIAQSEAEKIVKSFKFLFIEASNINIPQIIDEIIDDEILPLGLDSKRKNQTDPLKKLHKFIESSKKSVESIEKDVDKILNEFIVDIPGINSKDWKIKILFSEYTKLRQALSGLIDFTLYDKNKRKMESKGSGIQRVVFLSLMKYIANKSKKNVIWGIDEPEAFLQPALQKRTFSVLQDISKKQPVILTTHSQYFVDIKDVNHTHLFEATYEEREYVRRWGETFYKVSTFIEQNISNFEKIQKIKEHLGIFRNDGWEVMPYNLLVEGNDDKNYLLYLSEKFKINTPNILVAGGVSKIKGYLQFLSEFCRDLNFKPKVVCLLDHDIDGKKEEKSLKKSISQNKYNNFDLIIETIPRFDGQKDESYDYEIEDFIFPEVTKEATNRFLKGIKYNIIKKSHLNDRFKGAYDKNCILNFLTERTKTNNPTKPIINFEEINGGYKKIICKKVCDYIEKENIDDLNKQYPLIKEFIKKLPNF